MESKSRPIRVLLIAPSLQILGGQAVQAARLCAALAKAPSLQISFQPINAAFPGHLVLLQRIKFVRTVSAWLVYALSLLCRVWRHDVVHVFSAAYTSYTLWTLTALAVAKLYGKPIVLNYRDGQAEDHLRNWRTAIPTIRQMDAVVAPSAFLVDVFANFQLSIETISNILDASRFHYRPRRQLRPVFLHNRILEPLYDIPCSLRAFQLVQQRYPDASLTVAHDGPSRPALEELARDLGLQHTRFIGRVPHAEIAALYDSADIYLTSPNIDCMPGSILECFASGLPVIATDTGGIPYIATNEETALLVPVGDHEAMARAAFRLLSDPKLVERLTLSAYESCRRYAEEPVRHQWMELYQRLHDLRRVRRSNRFARAVRRGTAPHHGPHCPAQHRNESRITQLEVQWVLRDLVTIAGRHCKLMLGPFIQVSRADKPPLRVGLLLDTKILPRCFAEILGQIRDSSFARLELVVLNAEAPVGAGGPPIASPGTLLTGLRNPRTLLFDLYNAWDRRQLKECDDPLAPVDCSEQLRDVTSIAVEPERKGLVDRFPQDAVARIREYNLDVLIRFGFNILRGEILTAARCGVWSYQHGDNEHYRGGPAGFWEVYEGNPLSGAMLQVLTEDLAAETVLCKCIVATQLGVSAARNRPGPYRAANTFIIRKLCELHEEGWEFVQSRTVPPRPYVGRKRVYTEPTNWEMVRWLVPALMRKVARRIARRPTTRHWRLAMRRGTHSLLDHDAPPDLRGFDWIESPTGHFYADPFLLEHSGRPWLFFEDFDSATNRGRISAAEVRDNNGIGEAVPALAQPYHLSYPCVFRDGHDIFMIPEAGRNGTVDLYRCQHFPDCWTHEKELFRGHAVDTTVWVENGLYWFFVTLVEPRANFQELWLFFAESLMGAWTPHPANPISTDVRNNRGAGALFRHNGKLIRPSQDGSVRYGRRLVFNEIVTLTPDRYEERPGITIDPMKGFVGTHSYSHMGRIEIIDECALVPEAALRLKGR